MITGRLCGTHHNRPSWRIDRPAPGRSALLRRRVTMVSAAAALLLLAGPVSAVEMPAGEHLAETEAFARIMADVRTEAERQSFKRA